MARFVGESDRDERRTAVDEGREGRKHVKCDLLHLRRGLIWRVSHASVLCGVQLMCCPGVCTILDEAMVLSQRVRSLRCRCLGVHGGVGGDVGGGGGSSRKSARMRLRRQPRGSCSKPSLRPGAARIHFTRLRHPPDLTLPSSLLSRLHCFTIGIISLASSLGPRPASLRAYCAHHSASARSRRAHPSASSLLEELDLCPPWPRNEHTLL